MAIRVPVLAFPQSGWITRLLTGASEAGPGNKTEREDGRR